MTGRKPASGKNIFRYFWPYSILSLMKTTALVIGIDHYVSPDFPDLHCAVNDARAVAEKLAGLKVDVEACLDEEDDICFAYYDDFIRKLETGKYDAAIFYFAGHGERPNRQDSLILKKAQRSPLGDTVLLKHSLQVNQIAQKMSEAGDQINILILDACRNIPEGARGRETVSTEAHIKVPFQTFIAYSTSEGATAKDGRDGGHSPFTEALLDNMGCEGMEIEQLFKKVRGDMFAKKVHQYSWEHSCLIDSFCFNHGQLHPHYGSPYSAQAYAMEGFATPNKLADAVISGLQAQTDDRIDGALGLLYAHKGEFSPDELFVMGRCLLDACGSSAAARRNVNMTRLGVLATGNANPFLDGFMYGVFFDRKDKPRKGEWKGAPHMLDKIATFWDNPDFGNSLAFIQKELEPYANNLPFVPGKGAAAFELQVIPSEHATPASKVWVLQEMRLKGEHVAPGLSACTLPSLREEINHRYSIPRRYIRFKTSHRIEEEDLIIPAEPAHIAEAIENYFARHSVDCLDEMGHHYELCGVEDYSVANLSEEDGLLFIDGRFTLSAVLYLDAEEEIRDDISIDGTFGLLMEYDGKDWEMLDADIRLDRQSFD